ncbi:hypothetical protein K435DRAFT_724772 [Dendrothele bispora CBS 962.96]|uniref:RRM domain-containing protein n=1 Tax=Dendrothele bispora (strain CBS 962.96) TaxID=1314807 RepID=A0A4S8LX28_DENBC|nr:hypothetical protein K435DRAFT_724772 [Dendrothele bispora CBS 962.96]
MSKVVFVGNVPYNMGEEQLIDVFKSVGEVIGFRLVFDRDTGKPKGYGFCEFADHDTAASAVRNLNGFEVGGRPLRIDLADSDPLLEGKTTVRGELVDAGVSNSGWKEGYGSSSGSFLANLPPGTPLPAGATASDVISTLLATIKEPDVMDVLAHMKAFVITHPEQARALLIAHPQLSYALFQALLLNRVVDESILQRMLAATGVTTRISAPQQPLPTPPPGMPQQQPLMQPQPTSAYLSAPSFSQGPPPPPVGPSSQYPPGPPYGSMPPPGAMFPHAAAYYGRPPPPMPGMVATPPPSVGLQGSPPSTPVQALGSTPPKAPEAPQIPSGIPESQRQMLMQVLSMTPEQISALPEADQSAIIQLRAQFMNS